MEFRVLGPLEVVDGDAPIEIAGAKRKVLLAMLVLRANEVVRTERLIDDLWGEGPPRNASAALHNHVSRLRKALGPEVLVRREWGYVLRAPPESIDLRRFERLIAEAEPMPARERADHLARALTLWRAAPLTDIALEPGLQQEISRLEELRLTALERRIDADLESGRSSELIGELEALIAEHPLREHLRWQLILSLYRADRQAEALEVYRETRRVLAEELGLEPSPALRDLEKAILRQDAALAITAAARPSGAGPEKPPRRSTLRWLVPVSIAVLAIASGAALALALIGSDHSARTAGAETLVVVTKTTPAPPRPAPHRAHRTRRTQRGRPSATTPQQSATTTTAPPGPSTRIKVALQPHRTQPSAKRGSTPKAPTRKPPKKKHMNTPASKPSTTTASTAPTPPPPVVATISDTFDTDYIDGTKWYEICCSGTGATLAENAGDLEYAFAPDTTPGGQFSTAGGHVGTRCRFPGDFDARVDFALVDWPSGNGVVVSLYAFLGPANTALQVNRSSSAVWGEQYGGWFDQEAPGSAQLPDKTGTLRLLRKDGLVTGYFLHNGNWQTLSTHRIDLPATIALGANVGPGYGTSFGGQQVVVDLDNFTVTGANPACPSGSQPSSG